MNAQPAPDWNAFHAQGWNAFPLPPGTKKPDALWKRWQTERSTPDDHRRWKASGMNAALVTGAVSRFVVLDCDSPEAVAEAQRLGVGNAPRVDTARGAHFYFRHPGGRVGNKVGLRPDMDLRADGGFVVAPGSIHPSGAVYRWRRPPAGDLPPLPDWVTATPERPASAPMQPPGATVATRYGEAALQGEIEKMRTAPEGTRNDQLNKSAFALGQLATAGEIDAENTRTLLRQAALESGLAPDEVETTLASGWRAGQAQPRSPLAPIAQPGAKKPRIINAADLHAMTFAPMQWIIPDTLPEGLALLAGKPKAGKSYLAMQLALAVASGDGAQWGLSHIDQGEVLYLALEDSLRRLQERLGRMQLWNPPASLHFGTETLRIGAGGIEYLEEWCNAHPKARLIIIDTLRAIKAPTGKRSAYDEDAASVAPLLDFTRARPGLAVLVIHHVRKMEADDPFDMISGTNGLGGVFDTLMVLSSGAIGGATLAAQGRDLEAYKKALERDPRTGGWIIRGEASPRAKTGERQQLLDLLASAPGPMKLADLALSVEKNADTVRRLLQGLIYEGLLHQPRHGCYALTSTQNAQVSDAMS